MVSGGTLPGWFKCLNICFSHIRYKLCNSLSHACLCRFLSPLSAVPLVALVGFGLYELGFPGVMIVPLHIFTHFCKTTLLMLILDSYLMQVAKCVEIGLPELIILVFISQVCDYQVFASQPSGLIPLKSEMVLSVQYLPQVIHSGKHIFDRFAVIFAIVIVWIYAHLLTVGGAYNGKPPKTQASCRTDRAGLIGAAPW